MLDIIISIWRKIYFMLFSIDWEIAIWQKIYKKWFNMEIDISNLSVPKNYNPQKHFLLVVAKGITMNAVVAAMRKRFKVYLYIEDLDTSVTKNDRTPENGTYLVLFYRNIEADEEFKNMSADNLAKKGHKGITLLERLLLEVCSKTKCKKHLDIDNWTLCSDSRRFVGRVPRVGWHSHDGKLDVGWFDSDHSSADSRSRVVVSF